MCYNTMLPACDPYVSNKPVNYRYGNSQESMLFLGSEKGCSQPKYVQSP